MTPHKFVVCQKWLNNEIKKKTTLTFFPGLLNKNYIIYKKLLK